MHHPSKSYEINHSDSNREFTYNTDESLVFSCCFSPKETLPFLQSKEIHDLQRNIGHIRYFSILISHVKLTNSSYCF